MSAVRPDRRATRFGRVGAASPYARKQPPKKSSWSLSSLFGFLNPLRLRSSHADDDEDEEANASFGTSEELPITDNRAAQVLAARGKQMAQEISSRPPDSQHVSPAPSLSESDNPLVSINEYLQNKKNMSENEVQQLADYVQKHTPPAATRKHEPFRFTSIPATVPPASSSQSLFDLTKTSNTSRRTISRNPNGVYRWEGGGSARKSRYSSPAFGTTGASSGSRMKLRPPLETPKKDTKRRRVGDDAATSTAQAAAEPATPPLVRSNAPSPATLPTTNYPFPVSSQSSPPPSPSPAQKTPSKVTNTRSLPALRTPVTKPTLPAVPSPLRQAWGQGDSPPQQPFRQTKAASFMTGLIKEVVSPSKPDIANPYQTASPVKPPAQPRKVSAKRPRATGKPTPPVKPVEEEKEKEKEKEPELTPQAIIEATVPKGSKRSRPPSKLTESAVNEADEMQLDRADDGQAQKRLKKDANEQRPPTSQSAPSNHATVTVEEIEDVDMTSAPVRPAEVLEPVAAEPKKPQPLAPAVQINVPAKQTSGPKSSLPREPSKLRFSYAPETNGSPTSTTPSTGTEAVKIDMDVDAKESTKPSVTAAFAFSAPPTVSLPLDAKETALKAITNTLPAFSFTPCYSSTASTSAAALAAQKADKSTLPSFDFSFAPVAPSTSTVASGSGFNWAAAGMKLPATTSGWKCSTCMCDNPESAKEKCTVCDAPAPASSSATSSTTSKGFDWSAAGMKAPQTKSGWNCLTCMCDNPESAKEKCIVCEAPAPAATVNAPSSSTTATASKGGFDWSKAGVKPPAPSTGWKCSICMCDNPASAKEKCEVCDGPAPSSVSSASTTTSRPAGGFDWAAAGMKVPVAPSGWTCSTCMCGNPSTMTDKCQVCDAPR